ncbi:hypothetical protein CEUSTIGMA_g8110.t1 [Chlamydomonas eustigma]|uniref:Guanylate cyclase domain-containing protein n=1 Tax=Chlamydomonas eustigma TaxID=1157962 RepID=A0A250XC57_9CHLO|nr:hypothetical protein CEUSTIGMA_g8110.t1 [Chlamydomonas eustigma]|eukprot:GAX80675.1 hypothetical protein CEUSTIGMA_g8110.t1 [Chlamydomonas eustigma]
MDIAGTVYPIYIGFMDIAGFTAMCKAVSAEAILIFLNELFSMFDYLVEYHNIMKVETIGDCYIVAGGIMEIDSQGFYQMTDHSDPVDNASRVMAFAKDMLRCSKEVRMPHNNEVVDIRIGIHTGDCVTGLVGTKLPKFSIYGDTMNTASRMESTGTVGTIHISASTHKLLSQQSSDGSYSGCDQWLSSGGVEVKGKGVMETYVWKMPEGFLDQPLPEGALKSALSCGSPSGPQVTALLTARHDGVHVDALDVILHHSKAYHEDGSTASGRAEQMQGEAAVTTSTASGTSEQIQGEAAVTTSTASGTSEQIQGEAAVTTSTASGTSEQIRGEAAVTTSTASGTSEQIQGEAAVTTSTASGTSEQIQGDAAVTTVTTSTASDGNQPFGVIPCSNDASMLGLQEKELRIEVAHTAEGFSVRRNKVASSNHGDSPVQNSGTFINAPFSDISTTSNKRLGRDPSIVSFLTRAGPRALESSFVSNHGKGSYGEFARNRQYQSQASAAPQTVLHPSPVRDLQLQPGEAATTLALLDKLMMPSQSSLVMMQDNGRGLAAGGGRRGINPDHHDSGKLPPGGPHGSNPDHHDSGKLPPGGPHGSNPDHHDSGKLPPGGPHGSNPDHHDSRKLPLGGPHGSNPDHNSSKYHNHSSSWNASVAGSGASPDSHSHRASTPRKIKINSALLTMCQQSAASWAASSTCISASGSKAPASPPFSPARRAVAGRLSDEFSRHSAAAAAACSAAAIKYKKSEGGSMHNKATEVKRRAALDDEQGTRIAAAPLWRTLYSAGSHADARVIQESYLRSQHHSTGGDVHQGLIFSSTQLSGLHVTDSDAIIQIERPAQPPYPASLEDVGSCGEAGSLDTKEE